MEFRITDNLKKEDIDILKLRHLYSQFGYVHFKMNKFEEYDLYVTNKDFLASGNIITFTGSNGRLLALKPDVTLSIVKNYKDVPGTVEKVYYNENIYRAAKDTKIYKEIMQMGLECIGDLDIYNICEVLVLAAKSLEILNSHYILDLSHMGVIGGLLEALSLPAEAEKKLLELLREKNQHGIRQLCQERNIADALTEKVVALSSAYGPMNTVLKTLKTIILNDTMKQAVDQLEAICDLLIAQGFCNIHLDFSIVNDMSYYNGVLFRGYIAGIPSGVLSGGQYDELMEKMGKKSGAIGFAINMALIENYEEVEESYDVDALLLYEPGTDPTAVMEAVGQLTEKGLTVQAQKRKPEKLRYKTLFKLEEGGLKEIETNH